MRFQTPSSVHMKSKFDTVASPRACRSVSFLDFIAPYWFPRSRGSRVLCVSFSSLSCLLLPDFFVFRLSADALFLYVAPFPACLPTFLSLITSVALRPRLWAYRFFLSLCQCFSSCQSFTLSVSPFVTFSVASRSSLACRYCVHVCVHAWASLSNHCWVYMSVFVSFILFLLKKTKPKM